MGRKNITDHAPDEPQEVAQAQDTPPQPEPKPEPKPRQAILVRSTRENTPVRVGPGTQYQRVGALDIGEVLRLVRPEKTWLPVLHIGRVLWISTKDAFERDGTVIVTKQATRPRLGPGMEFDAARPFGVGHRFAKPNTSGWRSVIIGFGVGWISEHFSEEVPADE